MKHLKWFASATLVLIGIILFSTKNQPPIEKLSHEKPAVSQSSNSNRVASHYSDILSHLRKYTNLPRDKQNNQLLIDNVKLLHEKGVLAEPDTLNVYLIALQSFSNEELINLVKVWPEAKVNEPLIRLYSELSDEIAKRDDIDLFREILKNMTSDINARDSVIDEVTERMASFTPSNIKTITKELSVSDKNRIGNWLIARIENSSSSFSDRMTLLNEYSKNSDSNEINKHLLRAYVEWEYDPIKALNWIKQSDPEVTLLCDEIILKKLTINHPQEAANYINDVIATNDKKRITTSIKSVVATLQDRNPKEALHWGRRAYGEFTSDFEVIGNPFAKLYDQNPEEAIKYAESETDPQTKKILMEVVDQYKKTDINQKSQ